MPEARLRRTRSAYVTDFGALMRAADTFAHPAGQLEWPSFDKGMAAASAEDALARCGCWTCTFNRRREQAYRMVGLTQPAEYRRVCARVAGNVAMKDGADA